MAISLQVLAAGAAIGSMIVVLAAAFANYGSYGAEQESTWWVIFAVPLAIAAVVDVRDVGLRSLEGDADRARLAHAARGASVLVLLIAVASAR